MPLFEITRKYVLEAIDEEEAFAKLTLMRAWKVDRLAKVTEEIKVIPWKTEQELDETEVPF